MIGFFPMKFAFTGNISLVWWEIFLLELQALNIYYSSPKEVQKFKKRTCHANVNFDQRKTLSENYKPMIEFDYGLFTNSPRIIVACDFSPSSFRLKRGILPLEQNVLAEYDRSPYASCNWRVCVFRYIVKRNVGFTY